MTAAGSVFDAGSHSTTDAFLVLVAHLLHHLVEVIWGETSKHQSSSCLGTKIWDWVYKSCGYARCWDTLKACLKASQCEGLGIFLQPSYLILLCLRVFIFNGGRVSSPHWAAESPNTLVSEDCFELLWSGHPIEVEKYYS